MPELPEVEIVKQSLNKSITGKIIKDILIKNRNLRFKIPKNFEKNILTQKNQLRLKYVREKCFTVDLLILIKTLDLLLILFSLFSLIYEITCLSHSTAEISAAENRKKPKMLIKNKPLCLKVYPNSLV